MSVTVEVTRTADKPPTTVPVVLTQGPGRDEGIISFDSLLITFSVSPYPELGHQISAGDYRLRMTVERSKGFPS